MLEQFQHRMTPDERRVSEPRHAGCQWSEIGKKVGGSPAALRKGLAQALDRIARELGLDDHED
jgi:hypothetical protein